MSQTRAGARTSLGLGEALKLIVAAAPAPALESVPLGEALGRLLPVELPALVDQPPFDKSAMDGFATASPFPPPAGPWRVVGTAAAGSGLPRELGKGECLRIMTGAAVPPGALSVQRVEWTELLPATPAGTELVRFAREERSDNIIRRGENQRAGALLLAPRVLRAQDLGILASSGYDEVPVSRRLRVAVISTGDELASAGSSLGAGAIFDSNGPQLAAQALSLGCESRFLGIVRDDVEALTASFEAALATSDLLLVSGGVSMGEFDHVPRALARAGVAMLFHGLTMKPGKPVFFGKRGQSSAGTADGAAGTADGAAGTADGAAVFGLPGNPVSTFVAFEILVRAYIAAASGLPLEARRVGARLASPLARRESDRTEFLPARLETGADGLPAVRPLAYGGSSMLSALAEADCLVTMEIGVDRIEEGRTVDARLLRP
jgi:molybdopterin molybdotransferase